MVKEFSSLIELIISFIKFLVSTVMHINCFSSRQDYGNISFKNKNLAVESLLLVASTRQSD